MSKDQMDFGPINRINRAKTWFEEHPEDQVYIGFSREVVQFLTGDYESNEEVTLPLFRELGVDEEAQFRKHARENYVVGTEIRDEVWHPVWCDEARKMNQEAGHVEG